MRYLLIVLLLSGCAGIRQKQAAVQMKLHGPYCDSLGYERGTDAWRECVRRTAQQK